MSHNEEREVCTPHRHRAALTSTPKAERRESPPRRPPSCSQSFSSTRTRLYIYESVLFTRRVR